MNVSVTMHNIIIICTFAVQTVVCDSTLGRPSNPIAVPLRGNNNCYNDVRIVIFNMN